MVYATSARYQDAIRGSHKVVVRAQVLSSIQFGAAPTGGIELPLIAGDVRLTATADVKATLSLTVPGDYWDIVQPFGAEIFAERGIDFGDGTTELVPLGYYRIDSLSQGPSPYGAIEIDASDRTVSLQQCRVANPWQVPAGTSHRTVFEYLVNGSATATTTPTTYGMYSRNPIVPIVWTNAGYNPDTTTVPAGPVIDDSVYTYLAKLADANGALIRFAPTGEMTIEARARAVDATPDYVLRPGVTGTLISATRTVNRDGVYNVVRAVGSDPTSATGYRFAWINDTASPIRYNGPFQPDIRYYASPLLTTSAQADAAAQTLLARATGLPTELGLYSVPDPSLRPLDVIQVINGNAIGNHVLDEVTIPLAGTSATQIKTRTLNPVLANPADPEPPVVEPTPDPTPGTPTDPPPVVGGDPTDGTQVALARNWGAIVAGDEFAYTGTPLATKWGLYDGPGHAGNGLRRPSAFNVHDGIMTITGTAGGTTGGTAFKYSGYGYRVEVRMRVYATGGGGDAYHPVLILWPDNNQWPAGAEYDFAETDVGKPNMDIFMHLPNHTPYRQDHASYTMDIANYHNYACEWNPAAQTLKAWCDGVERYSGTGRVAQAPGPMHLTIQLDNFDGTNEQPAKMDIAWVRVYAKPNA
jgi:hypothetical protein